MKILLIALLGMAGVLSRYAIDSIIPKGDFPLGIFLVNAFGCFLAGIFATITLPEIWRSALLVGFAGGFTTLSTYALQSIAVAQSGRAVLTLLYLVGSPALGISLALLAMKIVR